MSFEHESRQPGPVAGTESTDKPPSPMPKNNDSATAKEIAVPSEEDVPSGEAPDTQDNNDDDESQYPSGLKVLILTIGLCLGMLVVALDNTVIGTCHCPYENSMASPTH
jgi:hypothetical protein